MAAAHAETRLGKGSFRKKIIEINKIDRKSGVSVIEIWGSLGALQLCLSQPKGTKGKGQRSCRECRLSSAALHGSQPRDGGDTGPGRSGPGRGQRTGNRSGSGTLEGRRVRYRAPAGGEGLTDTQRPLKRPEEDGDPSWEGEGRARGERAALFPTGAAEALPPPVTSGGDVKRGPLTLKQKLRG